MMALPRFDPGDAPTGTWDGTMAGIPKASRHPDEAWAMIEWFYLSDAGIEARYRETNIIPPLRDAWDNPIFHQPDPLYGGQKTGERFIELADQVPPKYTTWATPLAAQRWGTCCTRRKPTSDPASPPTACAVTSTANSAAPTPTSAGSSSTGPSRVRGNRTGGSAECWEEVLSAEC